jgi:CDP-diacylglycerol--glycerol-3-phosphate 3-phosphatidyltransferase/cardiolipin synthase
MGRYRVSRKFAGFESKGSKRKEERAMPINIPNLLTWGRILLIPLFVGVFYLHHAWLEPHRQNLAATTIFVLAALTDWLDGYLARSLSQTSAFGAFLDPVADKLMVAAALIMLVQLERVDAVVAFIIIGREIAISALREWMAKIGQGRNVAVSFLGKVKTVSQMVAIPMLLYHDPLPWIDPQRVGTWLIYLAALLTLWSMAYYLRRAWPHMAEKE